MNPKQPKKKKKKQKPQTHVGTWHLLTGSHVLFTYWRNNNEFFWVNRRKLIYYNECNPFCTNTGKDSLEQLISTSVNSLFFANLIEKLFSFFCLLWRFGEQHVSVKTVNLFMLTFVSLWISCDKSCPILCSAFKALS